MSDSDRLAAIASELGEVKGQLTALTNLLGAYQARCDRLEDRIAKGEDRINKGMGSALLALLTAILSFVFRK